MDVSLILPVALGIFLILLGIFIGVVSILGTASRLNQTSNEAIETILVKNCIVYCLVSLAAEAIGISILVITL